MFAWQTHPAAVLARKVGYCLLPLALGAGAALALLLAAGGPARPAYAGTLTYPGCGATIQACIDIANPGDTILISAGDYTESLTLSKAVSLTGALSSTTILHALPNTRVLMVTGAAVDSSVVISGLTFTGGNVIGSSGCPLNCEGGGILVQSSAQPRLENSAIISNVTSDRGGGVYAEDALAVYGSLFRGNVTSGPGGGLYAGGALALSDTQFLSNMAADGGGLKVIGAAVIQGALFQANRCVATCIGGGLTAVGSLSMTDTEFISNSSTSVAGGALFEAPSHALVTIQGGLFQGNTAGMDGGGFYSTRDVSLAGTQFRGNAAGRHGGGFNGQGSVSLAGTQFFGNVAGGTGGAGVANTASVADALFEGNTAGGNGGALFLFNGPSRVANSLFSRNAAAGAGSALYLSWTATIVYTTISSPTLASGVAIEVIGGIVDITDTIISNYATGISQFRVVAHEDYNLFDNVTLTTTAGVAHGGHSLVGNPAFRDPASDDYHLTPGSAAINAATDVGVATDFENDPRPFVGGFDIGFDEYVPFKLFLALVRR